MKKRTKILVGLGVAFVLFAAAGGNANKEVEVPVNETTVESKEEKKEGGVKMTAGQANAIATAKNYLKIMAFSKEGLYNQLLFEGYSEQDARFAVDNYSVNYEDQCILKGREYLNVQPFSEEGLRSQLLFEKFTESEVEFAIKMLKAGGKI